VARVQIHIGVYELTAGILAFVLAWDNNYILLSSMCLVGTALAF